MAEFLLVNPRRRKRKTKSRRRRKSVARRRRRSSFAARRVNPRRRRFFASRSVRRRRRNPSLRGITGQIMPTVKSGFMGAAGAIGSDLLYGYTAKYLPAQLTTGVTAYAVKALYAVLTGIVGNMVMRGRGRDFAVGAMTVVLHDALKEQLKAAVPALPLGDYFSFAPAVGYNYEPALPLSTGIGEYMTGGGAAQGMGEYLDGYNGY